MVMVQRWENHWKTIDANGALEKKLTIPSLWKNDHRTGLVDPNIPNLIRLLSKASLFSPAIFSVAQGLISMSHPGLASLPPGVLTRAHAHNMLMRARLIGSRRKNHHLWPANISLVNKIFGKLGRLFLNLDLGIGRGILDRSQSLFYFVPQDSHRQAGSSREYSYTQ